MQITRLRLAGFKSFVEPAELLVEPGLTGVVGPNGCGKSNLLEALRWVMGETSYKAMRGGAMDDVIFSGTDTRPGRNIAEVSVSIDNRKRVAPAMFNDADWLEITRRIQRDQGSNYAINGREARARDVQLLFADAATGARSQALVQQGRIGEIVSAKPQERRRILEDAAGVAGLAGRRHEAELRLKAADANLARLGDIIGQSAGQLAALKRQARQAQKYRELSEQLRRVEALQLHLAWTAAVASVGVEESALVAAGRAVAQLASAEAEARTQQTEQAAALQPLRDAEVTRAAVLHRLAVERETLEREATLAAERLRELETRLAQVARDRDREVEAAGELEETLQRLQAEAASFAGQHDGMDARREAARAALEAAERTHQTEQAANDTATAALATALAERRAAEAQAGEAQRRLAAAARQHDEAVRAAATLDAATPAERDLAAAQVSAESAAAAVIAAREAVRRADTALGDARTTERATRDTAAQARLKARQIETEVATLIKLLRPESSRRFRPLVADLKVAPGYEMALATALGDDLDMTTDAVSPSRWSMPADAADAALPAGAEALAPHVAGVPELARRLAQIGVVPRADGAALAQQLAPGQRLVSREGDLWRWDGVVVAADTPSAAARRLVERNRLDALAATAEAAQAEAENAERARDAAAATLAVTAGDEKTAREAERRAVAAEQAARDTAAKLALAAQQSEARRSGAAEQVQRLASSLAEAQSAAEACGARLATLPPDDALQATLGIARERAGATLAALTAARSLSDGLERDARSAAARHSAVEADTKRTAARIAAARAHETTLAARDGELRAELAALRDVPARVAERRQRLQNELTQAEALRQAAADALAAADTAIRDGERTLRETGAALANAREARARLEARLEAGRERMLATSRAIAQTLDCAPDACLAVAGYAGSDPLPDEAALGEQLAGLRAERDRLGGINLRAEEEAGLLAAQVEGLEREKLDLEEAIAKLRAAIASLNREARLRLKEAFEIVDVHFQRLFKVLFAGGEAKLMLIEGDDPLEAGLEILARPPGKKPQTLTLLSGGEKALTALALIFAVFLTNPSPICVLDEVDAPLDDANVHRFCAMMEEMRKTTDTRFLVITHHPQTMSRMDRLFGVTMAEKGVSQLVSVDLQTAERFRDAG